MTEEKKCPQCGEVLKVLLFLAITKRLKEVGELLGIQVLDHLIIGDGRYLSFIEDGFW